MPSLIWSKTKKRLMNLICEPLQTRIDFHVISYRKAHDQMGRAVMTVDKEEVFSMCSITSMREEYYREEEIRGKRNEDERDVKTNLEIQAIAHKQLLDEGIYARYDFFSVVDDYIQSPISELLKSEDVLVKALTMLDRRVGKRTLCRWKDFIQEEHPLVQRLYMLRCEVENIQIKHSGETELPY
ncbi:hypothetical protein KV679_02305 [Bacillus sp. JRC01]|nr:hypothetical protein [Bacillus sp. JRC01]